MSCFTYILTKFDDLNNEEVYVLYTIWTLEELENIGVSKKWIQQKIFEDSLRDKEVANLFDDFELCGGFFRSEKLDNIIDDLVKLGALKKDRGKIKLNCEEVGKNVRG